MSQNFAFFSNTIGEYEIFVNSKTMYWPRLLTKLTPLQTNKGNTKNEVVGDRVYLVTGASIRSHIVEDLKDKVISSPMITHEGIVTEIIESPIICYRYTHGNKKRKRDTVMLPFQMFEILKGFKRYLDEDFTSENLAEIERILKVGVIIEELQRGGKITFERAYEIGDVYYIGDKKGNLFILDKEFTPVSRQSANVERAKKVQMMPDKNSLIAIREACNAAGLKGEEVIQHLGTWQGEQYMKIDITDSLFIPVEYKQGLLQGISTRLLTDEDGGSLVSQLYNTVTKQQETNSSQRGSKGVEFAKNQILYGPPGTGKTYNTVLYAVAICDKKSVESLKEIPYKEVLDRYEMLKKEGRVTFTTFHQSYGYEEFIEGIKPVINQQDEDSISDLKYEYTSGVFKKFCEEAKKVRVQAPSLKIRKYPVVWNVLLEGTGQTKLKEECFKNGYIKIGWAEQDQFINEQNESVNGTVRRILLNFQEEMQEQDLVFIQRSNTTIDAIGIIDGSYEFDESDKRYPRKRKVKWIATNINEEVYALNKNTKLDRKTVYPLRKMDIEGVINLIEKYISTKEINVEKNIDPYVFIIDEINRGNISKIFGELITLIESTKRIGASEQTTALLPYTGEEFGVPNNVHILGTMNTADRSISLMDTALRRRFKFIEMMPDIEILKELGILEIDGIDVPAILKVMNERIEYLYDREHTIGHAFFTPLVGEENQSIQNLAHIFSNDILPLLQEYFYEDYSKIQLVLGDNAKTDDINKFVLDTEVKLKNIFKGNPDIDLPEKKYEIQKEAFYRADSYKQIY
ncbi:AAA family ATPase [Bacillus sp. FDAARGOS_235]|uniref:AAA family ATPase n=1 Tax=Bacillus sp. FDAARGOS_235 TaxID=1839798 RepID=UPI0011A8C95C|nr:AAA family ATPase [Bacillus sp. FDAARGOS_235]